MGIGGNYMIKKCLFKKAGISLITALLVFSTGALAANTNIQKTATNVENSDMIQSSHTLYTTDTWIVPDDFPTIQEAIDAANSCDKINVRTGIYFENVRVNKSVFLIGENRDTTFIHGNNYNYTMLITADHVTVSGFTIMYGVYKV